ncbi:precorrin-2 C(20)-methyltransferase [Dactylococcopsis salina]|uniref:Precorrin-2 C20-methyltransferase n=1 Tax=Dactylococcopsis salina (strain PCC 8305) TaxID=13035 RepID=K9YRQ3_DACS8|nr:precorrin-2 C(20)-methyltransferase [Dactylococcopsis salina]AFZ49631.1 precorrin-2 C20-methyltransferase [Dactylococcopsis salina PCC 8305]
MGKLYGVSVGTGDPELITVKGLKCLQQAKIVAFPEGIQGKPGIAQRIITPWLQSHQTLLPLKFPYVQDERELNQAWETAAKTVLGYLQRGEDVTFACEGDVSFYSTFTYLAQTVQKLDASVTVETMPGVCSPMAAAAALGIPLTTRSQRLMILPTLYHLDELETALNTAEVVVLMKFSSLYPQIWALLEEKGLLASSCIVERATMPEQVIYEGLLDRANLQLSYFSVMIIKIQ